MDDYYCLLLNGASTLNNGKYIFRDLKTLLFQDSTQEEGNWYTYIQLHTP